MKKGLDKLANEVFRMVGSKYAAPEVVSKMSGQIIERHIDGVKVNEKRKAADTFARAILKADENKQRQQEEKLAKLRTRADWQELEDEYVGVKPTVTEDGRPICACWKCKRPVRKRSKYCSENCRNEQKMAVRRLKKHGTYLNADEYKSLRAENAEKRERGRIVSYNDEYNYALLKKRAKKKAPGSDKIKGHKTNVTLPHTDGDKERLSGPVDEYKISPLLYKWYEATVHGTKKDVENVEKEIETWNNFTYRVEKEEARCAVVSSSVSQIG
jgi:hypothetical protein